MAAQKGPQGYANWRCMLEGCPARFGEEIQLYSDAHITGDVTKKWGPYQVLNLIGDHEHLGCRPTLALRVVHHDPDDGSHLLDMEKSDTANYFGGRIADEISALIGLALGVRLRAGGKSRDIQFDPPHERPRAEEIATIPVLAHNPHRPLLPMMRRTAGLSESTLVGYTDLSPDSAVALVRAARLYQHGLWLSESNPNDAWLMFVSAVEVAANRWRAAEAGDNAEKLFRELKPEWVERLEKSGDLTLVADMAQNWAELLSSTSKFLKFLKAHMPDPPQERPPFAQVDWTPKKLNEAMGKIYGYRSKALHAGTPFPAPMCSHPRIVSHENKTPSETPLGMASSSAGGAWMAADCPMLLHVFAYIVHGSLLKWWEGMKAGKEQPMPATEVDQPNAGHGARASCTSGSA